MRKIIVATDFSEVASVGIRWALDLAKDHDGRLRLVHALRLPSHATPYLPPPPDLAQDLQRDVAAKLEEEAAAARSTGIQVSIDLRNEDADDAINAAAREWEADLIVIGTRGLSTLEHLFLGSTAERVLERAPCPVLAVHPEDEVRDVHTILVPTDFSEESRVSAETAIRTLAESGRGNRLILVHAYHMPLEYSAYGAVPTSRDYLDEMAASAQQELEKWAATLPDSGWNVETHVVEGPASVAILRLAEDEKVDLIALGTHGHTGLARLLLGSTAKRIVQHAPCPVLTVRRQED